MELAGLDIRIVPAAEHLIRELRRNGLRVVVTSVVRSREQQAKLYASYLRGENPYPVAPPGRSHHELGLAWDMDVRWPSGADAARIAGDAWNSWGGVWSSRDRVHFGVRTT